jgi:hypothetical protein
MNAGSCVGAIVGSIPDLIGDASGSVGAIVRTGLDVYVEVILGVDVIEATGANPAFWDVAEAHAEPKSIAIRVIKMKRQSLD